MINPVRKAVISDIHGNRWALEAVLEDIRRREIKQVLNLGDCLYGPLDPAGTADILLDLNIPTVSGNQDRDIIETSADNPISPTLSFVRDELSPAHFAWLKSLTTTKVVDNDLFLCHGTPHCDAQYLLTKVNESGLTKRPMNELIAEVASIRQNVILCGHDHLPGTERLTNGRLIVNPGSVGLQAFDDDTPFPHVVESGSPDARYCIVSQSQELWDVEHVDVEYDWRTAANVAEKNGRPDWVQWLRTGRVTTLQ